MKDIKNRFFANMNMNVNTNAKNITTPPQQVYVNKQHVDKQRINNQPGFTIIEVALVLAIAGLIFLVVFLALPALQNSQKDTAIRESVAHVVSALESYEADHSGSIDWDHRNDPNPPNPDGGDGNGMWSSNGYNDGKVGAYIKGLSPDIHNVVIYNYASQNNPAQDTYGETWVAWNSDIEIIYARRCATSGNSKNDKMIPDLSSYAVVAGLSGNNYYGDTKFFCENFSY